ncbi:MAG: sugar ABC transporter permease [Chloroflexi bacterium]|nr:sugar ABC transporter permease [Chloroflexota bacterium]
MLDAEITNSGKIIALIIANIAAALIGIIAVGGIYFKKHRNPVAGAAIGFVAGLAGNLVVVTGVGLPLLLLLPANNVAQGTPLAGPATDQLSLEIKREKRYLHLQRQAVAFLFLLPAITLFLLFAWHPVMNAFVLSFQDVQLKGGSGWVGLENYERMLADPNFEAAWLNSLAFAGWSLTMGFLPPVFIAIMVNEMRVGKPFFRLIYFLPTLIPGVVTMAIWTRIFSADGATGGVLNSLLFDLGILQPGDNMVSWLRNENLVKPSLIGMMTWGGFGGALLIYYASLQGISHELYEAAEIDGANPFQRLRFVTLPQLRSTMMILLILQVLGIIQIFMEPFLMTQGGPGNATTTPVLEIYRVGFGGSAEFGLASAWSVVLMIVLFTFSVFYFYVTRITETEEG